MESQELPFIRDMFDKIAPRYDLLNRLLSLRQDVGWRRKMASAVIVPRGGRVLDVACGTGDVMVAIHRQKGAQVQITGVDFSWEMLMVAKRKLRVSSSAGLSLLAGDALRLPFRAASFHAVTIAFGIRNIRDKAGTLKTFYDVLVPGGMVLILELATPGPTPVRNLYRTYFQRVLPMIGRLFSRHRFAYSYLPESVARFPASDPFMDSMTQAGFSHVVCRRLTLGVANLFTGVKPR